MRERESKEQETVEEERKKKKTSSVRHQQTFNKKMEKQAEFLYTIKARNCKDTIKTKNRKSNIIS